MVSKKSLSIGLENFGLKKSLSIGLKIMLSKKSQYRPQKIWPKKRLSSDLKKYVLKKSRGIGLKNFGLGNCLKEFGLPTSQNMPNNEQHASNVHHARKIKKMPL